MEPEPRRVVDGTSAPGAPDGSEDEWPEGRHDWVTHRMGNPPYCARCGVDPECREGFSACPGPIAHEASCVDPSRTFEGRDGIRCSACGKWIRPWVR